MGKQYSGAEEVERIAKGLIPNFHPELATARLLFCHYDKATVKDGRTIFGKARKLSGFNEWALEANFVIEIAQDSWNEMTAEARTALVDHLLESCYGEEDEKSGEMKWRTREPEVQEYATILQRYGVWHEGLKSLVSIAKNIELDDIIEEEASDEIELEDVLQSN